jgi:hypothetical protein
MQTGYNLIQLYYSSTSGNAPTAGNLSSGELAINIADGILFYKDSAAAVQTIGKIASIPATKTADFTVAATDVWIINNKSGSSCIATLPAAASFQGRVLYFQNYQAQTLVSASSNVVPLAGGAASTSILLASSGDSATLVSDGTNWLMTQYIPNNILLLE